MHTTSASVVGVAWKRIGVNQEQGHFRVCQHEGQSIPGKSRIQRDVSGAGFKNSQQRGHHVGRSRHAHAHQHIGACAQFD